MVDTDRKCVLSPFGLGKAVDELVGQHPVVVASLAAVEGGLHAGRGDAVRIRYGRFYEAEDQRKGDAQRDHELEKLAPPAGSVGWGIHPPSRSEKTFVPTT